MKLSRSVINSSGVIEAQEYLRYYWESISVDGRPSQLSLRKVRCFLNKNCRSKFKLLEMTFTFSEQLDLLATGDLGGGEILVGGSWQNSIPTIRQAVNTTIDYGANLDASAIIKW
jgi:hypothetical protein